MNQPKPFSLNPLTFGMGLHEAEELRTVTNPKDYAHALITSRELRGLKVPEREPVLTGFIDLESIMIINGPRGGGKTWLVEMIGNAVAWGDTLGPWTAPTPRKVLLVDGEMPLRQLQSRQEQMNKGRGDNTTGGELFIYPEAYAYRIGLDRANLLDPDWRQSILDLVIGMGIELVILDNLSSLAPGIDENDKTPFDAINRWMLELRFHKVAIILTHHTGKSGEQRGTSAHEDHVDSAVDLVVPPGHNPSTGCKFIVVPTKDRTMILGSRRRILELDTSPSTGRLIFNCLVDTGLDECINMLHENKDMDINEAVSLGFSRSTYYRANKIITGNDEYPDKGKKRPRRK